MFELTFWAPLLAAISGMIVYGWQKQNDRQHQILAERRTAYLEYADAIAMHMFKKIDVNSEHHVRRRDALNRAGLRMAVIATDDINEAHRELVRYLSSKEAAAEQSGGMVEEYFDEGAQKRFDLLMEEMRSDALPPNTRKSRK